jgi:hypothetical protein
MKDNLIRLRFGEFLDFLGMKSGVWLRIDLDKG